MNRRTLASEIIIYGDSCRSRSCSNNEGSAQLNYPVALLYFKLLFIIVLRFLAFTQDR